jgi:hypothetical protein
LGSVQTVSWEAADPDDDELTYEVQLRLGRRGGFNAVATDLSDTSYAWDAQTTGGGTYEVRIVAGSGTLQASRVSAPFEVDLAPPQIGNVSFEADGADEGTMAVTLDAVDRRGAVLGLEWLVEGDPADASAWQIARPIDGLADSPAESFEFTTAAPPGTTIRVRAVDESGNLAYQSLRLPSAPPAQ